VPNRQHNCKDENVTEPYHSRDVLMSFAWYNMIQRNQTTMLTKAECFFSPEGKGARDNDEGDEKVCAIMMVEILPLLRSALGPGGKRGGSSAGNFQDNLILRPHGPLLRAGCRSAIQMRGAFAFAQTPRTVSN